VTPDWDVVVVGGGSAGSALAARLAEDPDRRVLLIEAGPAPDSIGAFSPDLLDAGRVLGADVAHPDNWAYPARLTTTREYSIARGRVLGGSSTINGAYFIRPRREDAERWAAAGGSRWSWDALLPVLRRLERDFDYGETAVHGGSGPTPVERPALEHPAAAAFVDAARSLGFADEADKNDQGVGGIGPVPTNAVDGIRFNAAMAYLLANRRIGRSTVWGDSTVSRILFERGAAVGVQVSRADGSGVVTAGHVVVCAGAIGTPALLLRSGVGPAAQLEALGIPVVADRPVGSALSDHPQVVVEWRPRAELEVPRTSWMTAALHLASTGGPAVGDIEVLQSVVPMAELIGGPHVTRAPLPFLVSAQFPVRGGRLALHPGRPLGSPLLEYGYLADDDDRRRLREGVRATAALLGTAALAPLVESIVDLSDSTLDHDDALDAWIAARLGTSLHTCGTVPFGHPDDPAAVVDGAGLVHGVRGLRIADTSILPTAPLRGPAVSALLVGEVLSDAIREGD
jgi:choline dehydrogenase